MTTVKQYIRLDGVSPYVNGTMGFERLGELTHIPAKSLMRMLGPKGNPQAKNLFDVIAHLQRAEGVRFEVSLKTRTRTRTRTRG